MHTAIGRITLLLVLCLLSYSNGFYLPGVAEKHFKAGEQVKIDVNKLTSVKTQLPFRFYDTKGFCKIKNDKQFDEKKHENLGEILRGDRIESSLYEVKMLEKVDCRAINDLEHVKNPEECTYPKNEHIKELAKRVKEEYKVQWIMDNLPAAVVKTQNNVKQYDTGFNLGFMDGQIPCINNHASINVVYGEEKDGSYVIIGFEVTPESRRYKASNWQTMSAEDKKTKCPDIDEETDGGLMKLDYDDKKEKDDKKDIILWTYSVAWEKSNIPWTQRWNVYLRYTGAQIHWISIVNSLMIVLFLTGMVAMIMMRTLRADLRRYNSQDLSDDEGETGWKLVHGDVFRPPSHPMALAVLIGSGVQVFGMTVITMVFAVLGFLSPSQRGMLVTAFLTLFVVMGVFAGYFSARCYKIFKGTHWKKNTVMTAFALPGSVFVIFIILNMFEAGVHSSGAVPFSTLASLMALWFGISVPLVFFGSNFGQRKQLPEDPVRTNQIPRQIPEQVWYMSPLLSILMGGILPFGAVFIELFFILTALWGNQLYYIFGFLFIVFVILVLTCAEITVVMCYFQLCAEDYHWWWRSFLTAGASAFYMLLYAVFYFVTNLHIEKFVSGLLYFGYTLIMTIGFFVLTGTIGFYACYFFVRKIYSSIHVD